ncbi:hypothetical protein E1193_11740 [Micromonospora sp. KC606]|uniref:hypothetical protein n=1 Tax=Micromonospora sp. KC606 TaxID=2530379 RepID=UPI0010503D5D|nr:hypothetical protein [Micromonospora sp. KC606]TDC82416.1 hypothetical protein E1193_11740 [Micromonospora sp. KC606]
MSRVLPDRGRISPHCKARRHGDYSAYRYGCRCPHARDDRRIYAKRQRQGRAQPAYVDGTGTRRRLQALAVLGWRWTDIADRFGIAWQPVQRLALLNRLVHVDSAARVAAVYRELSVRAGPSPITARRSVAKGWHGPMAWADIDDPTCEPDTADPDAPVVDEWAVSEALAGRLDPSRLADIDLTEAVRQLLADGLRTGQVRYRLRLSFAQVQRAIRSIRTALTTEETRAA